MFVNHFVKNFVVVTPPIKKSKTDLQHCFHMCYHKEIGRQNVEDTII
jgi:hypothetical protein